ncbi:MAG: helix-turn-helix domain-containing protein [Rhodoferax sp.]
MQLHTKTLNSLAQRLQNERQRQDLSREQLAAVCNVSTSFIRDAESNPGRCSLEKLLQLTQGLGLQLTITGWQNDIQADRPTITSTESPAA